MNSAYAIVSLDEVDQERLLRVYHDLMELSSCPVPSVCAASRSALAQIAQALNGQGLTYDLYSVNWNA